ncbi:MAG TPA: response regulator transcription factor [Terriglobales bacterium]|jgi:DNA-binding NarL/FixJ family response regulator|nr:response regulator transcription factor [Terriglobales bacterium]
MTRPRIFLADDHTLLVDAFRKLLEPEFEIVGAASNGRDLLANAPDLRPDLVIVDLGLPLLNGMAAGRELKKLLPRTRILVVTVNEDSAVAHEALREWASGYLLKKSAAAELTYAIREILSGKSYVAPSVAKKLTEDFIRDPVTRAKGSLTPRQREVLQLLAEGRTMKEAANVLNLTTRTVAFHKYRIMEDFGMHSNSELYKLAIRERLVSMG